MDQLTALRSFVHIEVPDNHVETISYTNAQNQPAIMRRQTLYLHQGEMYPEKIDRMLEADDTAYEPGRYLLAAGSFRAMTDKKGRVQRGLTSGFKVIPFGEAMEAIRLLSPAAPAAKHGNG